MDVISPSNNPNADPSYPNYYYYKRYLDGIEEVRRKGWEIFNRMANESSRDRLLALKLIAECNETKCNLVLIESPLSPLSY
jgi:hypothetical protein